MVVYHIRFFEFDANVYESAKSYVYFENYITFGIFIYLHLPLFPDG